MDYFGIGRVGSSICRSTAKYVVNMKICFVWLIQSCTMH
jgi:hypothetical protein